MPFIRLPGVNGKVFIPETDCNRRKKYPCKDCHSCQMCGEDRCAVCRSQKDANQNGAIVQRTGKTDKDKTA